MLRALRHSIATRMEVALEFAWFVLSLGGASLAAAFGRGLLALLLAALALGLGRHLIARQKRSAGITPKAPVWVKACSLGLCAVEVAAFVGTTDFPVRLHQTSFSPVLGALGIAALIAAYLIQVRVLAALSRRLLKSHVGPPRRPTA